VARVEDGREAHTGQQRPDDDVVDLVVDNVAVVGVVDRVDDLVVAIILVAVEIFGLASVSWEKVSK
jgi:hypothetical protein